MKPKSIIGLVWLLLLLNVQSPLLAQSKPIHRPKTPAVQTRKVYARFSVKFHKILTVINGTKEVCQDAHDTVIKAFWTARVDAAALEYQVWVDRIVTNIPEKESLNKLVIYEYRLDIKAKQNNKALMQFLHMLKAKKEVVGILPYEYPVSCHYLLYRDQLILFTYTGMLSWYEDFDARSLMDILYPRPR